MPSPVVAQLGSTFQTWSFATFSSWSLSETSLGRMASPAVSTTILKQDVEERVHTSWEILLVRKHQQQRILHFPVLNDTGQLCPRLIDSIAVIGVDNKDEALCACSPLAFRPHP